MCTLFIEHIPVEHQVALISENGNNEGRRGKNKREINDSVDSRWVIVMETEMVKCGMNIF